MQENTVLQKFQKFKSMIISSNIPSSLLLEMIESYITSDDSDTVPVEDTPVLDGQISLFDLTNYKELMSA